MSLKRSLSLSEDDAEVYSFLKRVKVEHQTINAIIKAKHPEIDIEEHELYKFLTIFNALIESNIEDIEKDNLDSEDNFTDIIKIVIITLLELVSKNIDSLDLPSKIKQGLEKLKQFLNKHGKNKATTETTVAKRKGTTETNNESNVTSTNTNSGQKTNT